MESYSKAYIGYVDILGFKNQEKIFDDLGKEPAAALITKVFTSLSALKRNFNYNQFTWKQYGDGYVFYSHDDDINNLSIIIKDCCRFIAMALERSIPLRIAITQGDIKINDTPDGITVSGSGWNELLSLEPALNWMGGVLHLPNFNGSHYETVQNLIQTTHLVKQQELSRNNQRFKAPFKEGQELDKDKTWFLNWHKLIHSPKIKVDQQIKEWWGAFPGNIDNNVDEVLEKQQNSIIFADYCRLLYEAANLIYHSDIDRSININEIDN